MNKLAFLLNNFDPLIKNENFYIWKKASLVSLADSFSDPLLSKLRVILEKDISLNDYNNWIAKNNFEEYQNYPWKHINYTYLKAIYNDFDYYIFKNSLSGNEEFTDKNKIYQSVLLQPEKEIPKLFFYKAKFLTDNKLGNIDKELANYGFLVQFLSTKLRINFDRPKNVELVKNFINSNKNKLDKIINLSSGYPKFLSCGIDGCAYQLSDSFVLKLFTDIALYNKTLESFNRLYANEGLANTEAMIYDVGLIGELKYDPSIYPIYYYIIEKMIPVTSFKKDIQNELYFLIEQIVALIDKNKEQLKDIKISLQMNSLNKENLNKFLKFYTTEFSYILKSNFEDVIESVEKTVSTLDRSWLSSLIEEILAKYFTERTDLHLGNLGISNNKFRYFDPYTDNENSNIYFGQQMKANPQFRTFAP